MIFKYYYVLKPFSNKTYKLFFCYNDSFQFKFSENNKILLKEKCSNIYFKYFKILKIYIAKFILSTELLLVVDSFCKTYLFMCKYYNTFQWVLHHVHSTGPND